MQVTQDLPGTSVGTHLALVQSCPAFRPNLFGCAVSPSRLLERSSPVSKVAVIDH